jgi:hypothetical protein
VNFASYVFRNQGGSTEEDVISSKLDVVYAQVTVEHLLARKFAVMYLEVR